MKISISTFLFVAGIQFFSYSQNLSVVKITSLLEQWTQSNGTNPSYITQQLKAQDPSWKITSTTPSRDEDVTYYLWERNVASKPSQHFVLYKDDDGDDVRYSLTYLFFEINHFKSIVSALKNDGGRTPVTINESQGNKITISAERNNLFYFFIEQNLDTEEGEKRVYSIEIITKYMKSKK